MSNGSSHVPSLSCGIGVGVAVAVGRAIGVAVGIGDEVSVSCGVSVGEGAEVLVGVGRAGTVAWSSGAVASGSTTSVAVEEQPARTRPHKEMTMAAMRPLPVESEFIWNTPPPMECLRPRLI